MDMLSFMLGKAAGGSGGGGDVTVEQLNVSSNNTYTAPSGKAYSPVVVNVPNTYAAGDEGKVVSNGALVSQTSDTVTQNGTVDTTLINSLTVNVSGGASNIATGTFTASESAGTDTVNTGYTGNGYPIAALIAVDGGANNSGNEWYSAVQRYAIGILALSKCVTNTTPNYNNTTPCQFNQVFVYKSSSSSASSYYSMQNEQAIVCSPDDPSYQTPIRFGNKSTMKCHIDTTNYGFMPGITYRYWIIYSE